jgi:hypothetical protein
MLVVERLTSSLSYLLSFGVVVGVGVVVDARFRDMEVHFA